MSLSISEKILTSITFIQQTEIFTIERFISIQRYFFQFIGLLILFYALSPIPISIYVILKSIILPIRLVFNLLPQAIDYKLFLLIFSLCLLVSYLFVKFSLGKRYSFAMKFLFILSLQIIFILVSIAFIGSDQQLLLNKTINENQTEISDIDNRHNFHDKLTYSINDILRSFFLSSKQHLSQSNSTCLLNAFTDLHCYDYTQMKFKAHRDFLNIYRHQSPFPIYISVLKYNGPICYQYCANTTCAIQYKRILPRLIRQLYRFIRFWLIISIPLVFIYKYLSKQKQNIPIALPSRPEISYPLDKNLEAQLRTWLAQEEKDGYQRLSETIRRALNRTLIKQYEKLKIETLQFSHANIHHVSQRARETIIIHAVLDIDHLIINVVKNDYFSIKISRLSGDLQIRLIDNIIEIKFTQLYMNNVEIIDTKNMLSPNEKESIINLLKDVIYRTVVQYNFSLVDVQDKPPSIPVKSEPEPVVPSPPIEIPPPVVIKTPQETQIKKLLVRIVKAVQLHDVEQPFCTLELNQPKQMHRTSLAKNGLNPFWDERFVFECNDRSNLIRLQIFDRKKPTRKRPTSTDTIYADVTIPFSYVTSTVYKQDVQITPQYPESIIRIEFSTLTDEEITNTNHADDFGSISTSPTLSILGQDSNKLEQDSRQSPSDEILTLACNENGSQQDYDFTRNNCHYASMRSQALTTFSTSLDADNRPRKARSFMNSFRIFSRSKKKNKTNTNGLPSPINPIPHSFSAEPFLSSTQTGPIRRQKSISRSFRNMFRSNSKQQPMNTSNFIFDHPDLLLNSPTKKRSFFRRFRSKRKQTPRVSANSLTSDDCTRTESVRNTPIRANVGRPVTMTN